MKIALPNDRSCTITEFHESPLIHREYIPVGGSAAPLKSATYRFYQISVNCDLGNPARATLELEAKRVRLIHLSEIYVNPEKTVFIYDCWSDYEVVRG